MGTAKTVTATGLSLSGADAGNYTVNTTATTTADITPVSLTGSITASSKTYNGTTTATIASRTLSGVIAGDTVTYVGGTATFSDKNVGTGKTVTATGLSLSGSSAGNYTVNTTATTTADITPRALTVKAAGVNKTYDGTSTATVTLSDNRLAGDVFTDSYTSATFADKNVGTAKAVSVTGIAISGADAGNYTVNTTATTAAKITRLAITGSITAANKVYDGTRAATITSRTLSGAISGDDVTYIGGTATFASKNVGTWTVTATGLSLAGADAGNYTVNTTATTTATITAFLMSDPPANGVFDSTKAATPLTEEVLQPIITEAIVRWGAAGVSQEDLEPLRHVTVRIDDLGGSVLGEAAGAAITLDRTADGYGWFIDPTPGDDSEFGPNESSAVRDHVDLLSVVAHELGHELGFGDDDGNDVMNGYLAVGVRRVPASLNRAEEGRSSGIDPLLSPGPINARSSPLIGATTTPVPLFAAQSISSKRTIVPEGQPRWPTYQPSVRLGDTGGRPAPSEMPWETTPLDRFDLALADLQDRPLNESLLGKLALDQLHLSHRRSAGPR